tara:strand:+ start:2734 stop:4125 length:1392 start_codon:yes stop_codon:yes gene_type:complete
MDFTDLQEAFARQELFEGKTWRTSPEPWKLSAEIVSTLDGIGQASLDFYKALEVLYLRSADGKKLLRNKEVYAPWVAEYLDRGKPSELVAISRSKACKGRIPPVIRPDLLVTAEGFSITEFDSVPGGIGLTAYLNALYDRDSRFPILGEEKAMEKAFYRRLASLAPKKDNPVIVIAVSEESATYKPEMDWLANRLQLMGHRVFSLLTNKVFPLGGGLYFDIEGNPEKIDVVYRFFELFDLENIETSQFIIEAWENGEIALDPPLRPFFEEKSALALFHHHLLRDFWRESISKKSRKILDSLIPQSWIVDPSPLPPGAAIDGPLAQGRQLHSWMDLAKASQKERNLVLKISGFHETAWGSRSVVIGNDVSKEEWASSLTEACDRADSHLHVIQEFRKSICLSHPLYSMDGEVYEALGRLRLNPYYFVNGDKVELAGALATFCPPDKKIIHGMEDAAMLPCSVTD